jgi:hypothetical protein
MRWLYLLMLACTVTAQAQNGGADTALPEYFKNLPHYSIPGIDDSIFSKRIEQYIKDSTYHEPPAPPQRKYYFLYKPDPKRGWLPGEYKMWLDVYHRSLRKFIKDSIEYQQYQHRRDSLEHLLDSLRRMAIPVLACQARPADYWVSNDATFSWHSFSAIAYSLFTRSIRRRSNVGGA